MELKIRNATIEDLPKLLKIYEFAKQFMIETGNPHQWEKGGPTREILTKDISKQTLYVLENDTGVHGVFMFAIEEDPTYQIITEGNWKSPMPYGVIHRIAGDGQVHGILHTAVTFCFEKIHHLRIDTHHDNHVMQSAILKCGFEECGVIYLADGSPRIAYERVK